MASRNAGTLLSHKVVAFYEIWIETHVLRPNAHILSVRPQVSFHQRPCRFGCLKTSTLTLIIPPEFPIYCGWSKSCTTLSPSGPRKSSSKGPLKVQDFCNQPLFLRAPKIPPDATEARYQRCLWSVHSRLGSP